jgi:hypothetical protein
MKTTAIHLGCLFKAPTQENVRLCMFVRELLELEAAKKRLQDKHKPILRRHGETDAEYVDRVRKEIADHE